MLLNVKTDEHFQAYLDREEQRLFPRLAGILIAAVRLHINQGAAYADGYVRKHGRPALLRAYRRIFRDQFNAIQPPREQKAARGNVTQFMAAQLAYLQQHAAIKITGISESLRRDIADTITGMVGEGKSNAVIANAIRAQAPDIGEGRAATIARTETHNAALDAIDQTLQYKNIAVQSKTWWSAQDARVRPTHREAHGQVKPYDEPFEVGGDKLMRPGDASLGAGPEEIINCRCSVLFNADPAAQPEEPEPPPPPRLPPEFEEPAAPPPIEELKTPAEQDWHDYAFVNSPPAFTKIIDKLPPLDQVMSGPTPLQAYFQRNSIHMGVFPKDAEGQAVWRHEYGHNFDYKLGQRELWAPGNKFWSEGLLREQQSDEKAIMTRQAKAKTLLAYSERQGALMRDYSARVNSGTPRPQALHETLATELTGSFKAADLLAFQRPNTTTTDLFAVAVRIKDGGVQDILRRLYEVVGAVAATKADSRKVSMLADFVGALTANKVGWGHDNKYYAEAAARNAGLLNRHQGTEMVANYWGIAGHNAALERAMAKLLKLWAPRTWAAIGKKVKEEAGK